MSTEENIDKEDTEEKPPLDKTLLQRIVEGALLSAGKPMSVKQLSQLFEKSERPANDEIQSALEDIQSEIQGRGFELKQVASGYRFQVLGEVAPWISKMWDEKPQKYSRALLETLSLVAYRQPITRGDIENIRGVAVSSHIIKTLMEREWIRIVGHKDVPGRPAMFATTRNFLDYFNLKDLDELPSLAEIRDLDSMNGELALEGADTPPINDDNETNTSDDNETNANDDNKTTVVDLENVQNSEQNNDTVLEPQGESANDRKAEEIKLAEQQCDIPHVIDSERLPSDTDELDILPNSDVDNINSSPDDKKLVVDKDIDSNTVNDENSILGENSPVDTDNPV